jgi:hypothetical protein
VPRVDRGRGTGMKLKVTVTAETAGEMITIGDGPNVVKFRNVIAKGSGRVVTLQGLAEIPGELIDLRYNGRPTVAGTFKNASAFGCGEQFTLDDLPPSVDKIELCDHCEPHTEMRATFRNDAGRLFAIGDAARIVSDSVLHLRSSRRVPRVDGALQSGNTVDLIGNKVVLPGGRALRRTDART